MFVRGDNVNGFHPSEREPDPNRLLQAYFHSGVTLNNMRSLLSNGFADLHHPRKWHLGNVRSPALHDAFEAVIDRLEDALDFMRVVGADPTAHAEGGLVSSLHVSLWRRRWGTPGSSRCTERGHVCLARGAAS